MPLKVYISSTFTDLEEYRRSVYEALRQMRIDAIAMEDYDPQDTRPLEKCLDDVASSDIYVGIFALRYGYIPEQDNPDRLSITELEYHKAKENDIPYLIFLLDENVAWLPRYIDGSPFSEEKNPDKILRLRSEFKKDRLAKFFKNKDELAKLVSISVGQQVKFMTKRSHKSPEEHFGIRPYQRVQDNLMDFTGRGWIVDERFIRSRIEIW